MNKKKRVEISIDERVLELVDKQNMARTKFILDAVEEKLARLENASILDSLKTEIQNLKIEINDSLETNAKIITNKLYQIENQGSKDYQQVVAAFGHIQKKLGQ